MCPNVCCVTLMSINLLDIICKKSLQYIACKMQLNLYKRIVKLCHRFNSFIVIIFFSTWCLQHAHPWYKNSCDWFQFVEICESVHHIISCVPESDGHYSLVIRSEFWLLQRFVGILAKHQGHFLIKHKNILKLVQDRR